MELFENIELTETEIFEALRQARETKHFQLKKIEYMERIKAEKQYRHFSANELYEYFSMQYVVNDSNRDVIANICRYFANDVNFKGDLNKGLILMGGVGVGKTSIMRFFLKNQRFSYRVDSCRDVESNFASIGDEYIDKVSSNLDIAGNADPFGHKIIGFCFDDLGTEANGKHYGKEKNVMAEVILNRYDNASAELSLPPNERRMPFISTHLTTNLTTDELKKQYGTRVTDRMKQMFNLIKFPVDAKSWR